MESMERLVQVPETEVHIDFTPNCKCRANVRLNSLCATSPVAFKVQTSSPHKFLVNPPTGLLPPLGYATLQIILKPQPQAPPAFPRSPSDRFLLKTALFPADVSQSTDGEFLNSWFSTLPRGSTHDIRLKVAFVGLFLLHHAVGKGDCEAVKNIIKRQKQILLNLAPNEAESLLRVAADLANSEDMVNILLEAGLSIQARARICGTTNVGFYLIDPRWESKGWNELHVAALFDRTEETSSLVKGRGSAALDCRDKEGRTALHFAASKGNIGCAKVLLESGAEKDARSKDGRTALYRAAANGDHPMAEMLMEAGADPTISDHRGRSPLDVAREKGQENIIATLERGEQVLMAARRGEVDELERLLVRGASAKYCDQYGVTALHAAAMKGQKEAVLLLLDKGWDLECCRDNEGHEPLHMAVESGSIGTVEVLVGKGANVNSKTKSGATPLYIAKALGYEAISKFLISKGAFSSTSSLSCIIKD